jgi:hypothetical protein
MDNFLRYKERLGEYEEEYNLLVKSFLDEYPTLVDAAAFQLGDLFDRTEYPEVNAIAHKFRFQYVFSPVPTAGDFRIDINEQAKAELTDNFNRNFDSRIKGAMKEAWTRLHECLTHVSERLEDVGDNERKVFRDSLVGNAQELIDMLKVLNVTKDPDLERARQQLSQTFTGLEVKDLRESAEIRKDVRAQVNDILNKFNW